MAAFEGIHEFRQHPVVRTHPVTGQKTLYVNENFTKEIVGVEKRFSESLLDFLNRTVAEAYEYQVRWKWSTNAVAIWDNRATFHTGIFDYCEYFLGRPNFRQTIY